jgi:hypothetical protein
MDLFNDLMGSVFAPTADERKAAKARATAAAERHEFVRSEYDDKRCEECGNAPSATIHF